MHGDYHHGNIILDKNKKVAGLIDLDWARTGTIFDDLGFYLAMYPRDYKTWSTEIRSSLIEEVIKDYNL